MMMTMFKPVLARMALLCSIAVLPGLAAAQAVAEPVWITMTNPGATGGAPVKLEATLYKPAGAGPFPVVIFSHGSSGGPIPASYTEKAKTFGAMLTARNIALLVPMRRGRGQSEGSNGEEPSACSAAGAQQGIAYAMPALDASMAYLSQQPWADMQRIVLAGHSRGGLLSALYAGERPGGIRGIINFSGGWKNDTCGEQDINIALFQAAGKKVAVPAMFIYGRGDGFYTDASVDKYVSAYKAAGGQLTFHAYQPEGFNGHLIFHRGAALWEKDVASYLTSIGMAAAP